MIAGAFCFWTQKEDGESGAPVAPYRPETGPVDNAWAAQNQGFGTAGVPRRRVDGTSARGALSRRTCQHTTTSVHPPPRKNLDFGFRRFKPSRSCPVHGGAVSRVARVVTDECGNRRILLGNGGHTNARQMLTPLTELSRRVVLHYIERRGQTVETGTSSRSQGHESERWRSGRYRASHTRGRKHTTHHT